MSCNWRQRSAAGSSELTVEITSVCFLQVSCSGISWKTARRPTCDAFRNAAEAMDKHKHSFFSESSLQSHAGSCDAAAARRALMVASCAVVQTLTCPGVTCPYLPQQHAEASDSSAFVSAEVQLDVMPDKSGSVLIWSCWGLQPAAQPTALPLRFNAPLWRRSWDKGCLRPRQPSLCVCGSDPPTVNPVKRQT